MHDYYIKIKVLLTFNIAIWALKKGKILKSKSTQAIYTTIASSSLSKSIATISYFFNSFYYIIMDKTLIIVVFII